MREQDHEQAWNAPDKKKREATKEKARRLAEKRRIEAAKKIAAQQAERDAAWPMGSDDARCLRSLNAFREATSAETLPSVICCMCAEFHPSSFMLLIGSHSDADVAFRTEYKRLALIATYGSPNLQLEPKAIRSNGDWQVCRDCFNSVRRRCVPRCGLLNDLWLGAVPDELRDLRIPEQLMISQIRCKMNVLRFECDEVKIEAAQQRGIKGHAISFPQVGCC